LACICVIIKVVVTHYKPLSTKAANQATEEGANLAPTHAPPAVELGELNANNDEMPEVESLQKESVNINILQESVEINILHEDGDDSSLGGMRGPATQSVELPPGWEECIDPTTGDRYYLNDSTGEESDTPPSMDNVRPNANGDGPRVGAADAAAATASVEPAASAETSETQKLTSDEDMELDDDAYTDDDEG
jgi:hypothetical protein